MARDFQINGECLAMVKGHGALADLPMSSPDAAAHLWELGLTTESVTITPTWQHKDINTDDFGPNIPAELLWQLADVRIRMTLIHYDRDILRDCMIESMGGGSLVDANGLFVDGTLAGAGQPMGNGLALFASGNHYISLNLTATSGGQPWRFPTSVLTAQPLEIPIGTKASLAVLNWRAIPYRPLPSQNDLNLDIVSSGAVLWDHTLDTNED